LSKNKNDKPQREVTRRQLSHWQRESRLQRIVIIAGIIVIVAILAIAGTGVYMDKYKPYHTTVLKVGNASYSMDYLIDMLALSANSSQYANYISYLLAMDTTMTREQLYQNYLLPEVKRSIQQAQLITEAAATLTPPVTVSDDEVKTYLKDNQLPSSQVQSDQARFQLLVKKLQSDYFDKQIGPAEQRNLRAMFLESQQQVNEVKAKFDSGVDNFSYLASQYSSETVSKEKNGDFKWLPKGVLPTILGDTSNTTLDDAVFDSSVVAGAFNQVSDDNQTKSIGYWVLKITDTRVLTTTSDTKTSDEVHLFAMLLGSREEAENIIQKLDGGADFATEAKIVSLYDNATNDGGDLGFIAKGVMGDAVDAVIFPSDPAQKLGLNTLSAPIPDTAQTTQGGIWFFQVTEINPSRDITGENRTTLVNQKLDTWASKALTDNQDKVEDLLTAEQQTFAVNQALKR
jgi:parvulin-like peptidyl-prolyl isomerase